MFKTFVGPVEDDAAVAYLRPETAQGIFVNFKNVQTATRRKLPFGIAQIGKSFRNEITPGNFIFRTREFEQMEMRVLRPAGPRRRLARPLGRGAARLVRPLRHQAREPAALQPPEGEARALRQSDDRHRVRVPLGLGRARGHRQPHRLRPDAARPGERRGPDLLRRGDASEHVVPYVIEPSAGVDRAALRLPAGRLRRGAGQGRHPGGAAASQGDRADQGRRPAALAQGGADHARPGGLGARCGRTGMTVLRRRAEHRPALPPAGRDRHAVLRDGRLPEP